jgi:hypothetical protein
MLIILVLNKFFWKALPNKPIFKVEGKLSGNKVKI